MSENIYKYVDNKLRVGRYKKDDDEEQFLDRLNFHLTPLEPTGVVQDGNPFPIIFVLGLPRSGTTVFTQLLSHCLDVGIINNIIARFWLVPVTGIRLSKAILGDRTNITFQSDYGKTMDVSEPHEFSYFWQHWLKLESMPNYDPLEMEAQIDWDGFRNTLRNMASTYNKPLMMKAPLILYHLKKIANILPEAMFLLINRDLADVAVSISNGRKKYYGDDSVWLGMYPFEYEYLREMPGADQVAGQVYFLDKSYRERISEIDSNRTLSLKLQDLCANPNNVVDILVEKILKNSSFKLQRTSSIEKSFDYSSYRDTNEYLEFRERINKFKSRNI